MYAHTKRNVGEMKLKVGDKVSAVIKSTELILEKTRVAARRQKAEVPIALSSRHQSKSFRR
jgi:hypothetical protein